VPFPRCIVITETRPDWGVPIDLPGRDSALGERPGDSLALEAVGHQYRDRLLRAALLQSFAHHVGDRVELLGQRPAVDDPGSRPGPGRAVAGGLVAGLQVDKDAAFEESHREAEVLRGGLVVQRQSAGTSDDAKTVAADDKLVP